MPTEPLKVPFDVKGNQLGYGKNYRQADWRDNFCFYATLTLTGISKGRSSIKGEFTSADGYKYEMFLSDLTPLLQSERFCCGRCAGYWTFRKAGSNYGICLAEQPKGKV